jgi:hypothetical protein
MRENNNTEGGMRHGIWRTEKRAQMFRCKAGFLRNTLTGAPLSFATASEAQEFLKSELAESIGADYEIRSL